MGYGGGYSSGYGGAVATITREVGALRTSILIDALPVGTIPSDEELDGQDGAAELYTTPNGTTAWRRTIVAPGSVAADFRTAQLVTPAGLDRSVATNQVWHHHGATGNDYQIFQTGSSHGANDMLNSWLDLGWACVSLRLGTTGVVDEDTDNNDGQWGNANVRAGAADLFAWATGIFTFPAAGVCWHGVSAGGVHGLNTAKEAVAQSFDVAAMAFVDPAMNLAWCYDKNYESAIPHSQSGFSAAGRADIIDAYSISANGGTGGGRPYSGDPADSEWTTKVDTADGGHDPCRFDLADLPYVPVYMIASTTDAVIDEAKNRDYLIALLEAEGWDQDGSSGPLLLIVTVGGSHAANSHFVPSAVNPFFTDAL